VSHFISLVK